MDRTRFEHARRDDGAGRRHGVGSGRLATVATAAAALLGTLAAGPGRESRAEEASRTLPRYYAREAREDAHGVVAPWHRGQNGPCDERLRIAVELYRRYPWAGADRAVLPAPHIVYNTHWSIDPDGTIAIPPTHPWMCGDLSQRALSIIRGLTALYAYDGEPLAFTYVPLVADYVLDYCLTPPDHPWPSFPVSTPTRGRGYGRADPAVANQLDLGAYLGIEVLRAWRLTGTPRYLEAARSWAATIARKRNLSDPELPPWSRYVSPEHMLWSDELTGGASLIAEFLDAVLDTGFDVEGGAIREARDAAREYVRRDLLPRWTENEVWGRHYWDMEGAVYCGVVPWICGYFLDRPDAFPAWKADVRNILGLVFPRNCVDPASRGGLYSGAWAFPESSLCCGTSLSYNQYTYAPAFLRHGRLAGDERTFEIGRRMLLMATHDSSDTGRVLDGVDGRVVAAGEWLNLAHPWPLCQILEAISIAPELFAPARENHLVRTSSVVTDVAYDDGRIAWRTDDARPGCIDVLRLAFEPSRVSAGGAPLPRRERLDAVGWSADPLGGGDFLVSVRHDGARDVVVEGDDPQRVVDDAAFSLAGEWTRQDRPGAGGGSVACAQGSGASAEVRFGGNQARLVGSIDPEGGTADVWLDGERQLTLIDCWSPSPRDRQTLWRRSGLADGLHTLRVVARGEGNPLSRGTAVLLDALQRSEATAEPRWGEGGGPTGPQRMVFGYARREDWTDSAGNAWRPGTEVVVRLGYGEDAVRRAFWTDRRTVHIAGTPDPELYRYGVHGKELSVLLTVGPGRYAVRLLFADTGAESTLRASIGGRVAIEELDVRDAAGGRFRALDLTFPGVEPRHGAIEVRLEGLRGREACLQALELDPSDAGAFRPYRAPRELLANGDLEADLARVREAWDFIAEAPTGWSFLGDRPLDRGLQNIEPQGRGKVGAWLGAGQSILQVAPAAPERGEAHRLRASLFGKGREGIPGSTSVGNRIGLTVCWTTTPEAPLSGTRGKDWDVVATTGAVIADDRVWTDLDVSCDLDRAPDGTRIAVEAWYRQEAGTSDSYGYIDSVSLERRGGFAPAEAVREEDR